MKILVVVCLLLPVSLRLIAQDGAGKKSSVAAGGVDNVWSDAPRTSENDLWNTDNKKQSTTTEKDLWK